MTQVWRLLYGAWLLFSFLGGAGLFRQADYSHSNIDWYFVAISFGGGLIFPSLAIWHASSKKLTPVPMPSFSRGPQGGWWTDPLQWVQICNLALIGGFAGTLIGAREASEQGIMAIYWKGALALGFVMGSVLARRFFRSDIIQPKISP